MSKKLHPLVVAFRAADALSDDEKTALRDYLRPAPKPRQKGKGGGKSAQKQKAATTVVSSSNFCARCGTPFDHNAHHIKASNDYHEFVEPAGEAKGASA